MQKEIQSRCHEVQKERGEKKKFKERAKIKKKEEIKGNGDLSPVKYPKVMAQTDVGVVGIFIISCFMDIILQQQQYHQISEKKSPCLCTTQFQLGMSREIFVIFRIFFFIFFYSFMPVLDDDCSTSVIDFSHNLILPRNNRTHITISTYGPFTYIRICLHRYTQGIKLL